MKVPDGMNEAEVLSTIELVVDGLAARYQFGHFDVEDLKQEGRLECLRKLHKYKPDSGHPLENFFRVIVRNRYINLKRDEYLRKVDKCDQHKDYDSRCSKCRRSKSAEGRNTSKLNIIQPVTIDNVDDENEPNTKTDCKLYDILEREEVNRLIDRHLPPLLRPDYVRMLQNVRMPKQRANKVIRAIREILEEHYDADQ